MKLFKKDGIIKFLNKIVIIKDDMQILNPTEEMVLEDGWVEYIKTTTMPVETEEDKLNTIRQDVINKIIEYDSSTEVNEFFLGEASIWMDKATRSGLMLRFESELKLGDKHTTLWYNGVQYPLELTVALNMLYMIEKYASQCYDNTQLHLSNVSKLETIEDIQNYDYKTGYPEKLRF